MSHDVVIADDLDMSTVDGTGMDRLPVPEDAAEAATPCRLNVLVQDGVFDPQLVHEAAAAWPDTDWQHWLKYDAPEQQKRTCRLWWQMPETCQRLLLELATLDMSRFVPGIQLLPDLQFWGAGMCDMAYEQQLDWHLDHDVHPHWHRQRRATMILFLSDGKGGQLCFRSRTLDEEMVVSPRAGRLVIFENGRDYPWHRVTGWRSLSPRMSLSLFWYGGISASSETKARFARQS